MLFQYTSRVWIPPRQILAFLNNLNTGIFFPEDTMSRLQIIHLNIISYIINNKTKMHHQNNLSSVQ